MKSLAAMKVLFFSGGASCGFTSKPSFYKLLQLWQRFHPSHDLKREEIHEYVFKRRDPGLSILGIPGSGNAFVSIPRPVVKDDLRRQHTTVCRHSTSFSSFLCSPIDASPMCWWWWHYWRTWCSSVGFLWGRVTAGPMGGVPVCHGIWIWHTQPVYIEVSPGLVLPRCKIPSRQWTWPIQRKT
jgi:hypothetical protein